MSIIFMRHAESHHNVVKKQMKSKDHMVTSLKKTQEYRSFKINPQFKDQMISTQGSIQTESAAQLIDWDMVQLVLVSPMRRCLETCRILLQKSNKNIQVRAIPQLKGRLSGSWDYGSSVKDLKHLYPQYNFESLTELPEIPWYIKPMKEIKQSFYLNHKGSQLNLFKNLEQDYGQFRTRIDKAKKIIQSHTKSLKQGAKILVITHSCVLRTLTAKQFDEKGKGISSYKFKNSVPLTLSPNKVVELLNHKKSRESQISDLSSCE